MSVRLGFLRSANQPLIDPGGILLIGRWQSKVLPQSIQIHPQPLSADTSGQSHQQQPQQQQSQHVNVPLH